MNAHVDEHAAHAVYSPSSGHVWGSEEGCTASATAIAALRRVIPEEEREESADGTAAHSEIDRVLGPIGDGGAVIIGSGNFAALTGEIDADHPAVYGIALFVDYARKLADLTPGRFWIEQRVRLTEHIWGRLDLGHWHAESATITIVDYKNGFVGVDAEENEQFRIYAAALILQYHLPAKWVRYVCVQPNDFRPGPRVKQWIEPVESLMLFAERVAAIPKSPLTFRFGAHCRDCPLFGTCEPTKDILAQFTTAIAAGNDPTPEQIPLFLACEKPIDHFFESMAKKGLKFEMSKPGSVPGMGIFTSVKHRTWLDKNAAREAVISAKGVTALNPPTPAQAEDMGVNIDGLTTKPEGGPVLAYLTDKRKPWAPKSVESMFGGVAAAIAANGGK